ncbi:MAG: hypothetical protein QMB89_04100, partial [Flavobacteriales bacterium]
MNCLFYFFNKISAVKSPILLMGILFLHSIHVFAIEINHNKTLVDGCMDIEACNYDPLADTDNGTCSYDDTDGDGVCDGDEILGCNISLACNYDPAVTEYNEGSCDFDSCYDFGCFNVNACNYDPL